MTAASVQGFAVQASPEIVQHWGWFLAFGIGLLALGVAAAMRSITATIVSMVFFGWLLLLHPALNRAGGHGRKLGRFLPAFARRDSVRGCRSAHSSLSPDGPPPDFG